MYKQSERNEADLYIYNRPRVYLEENRQDTSQAYVMYNIRHHFIPLSYVESVLSLKGPDTHNISSKRAYFSVSVLLKE